MLRIRLKQQAGTVPRADDILLPRSMIRELGSDVDGGFTPRGGWHTIACEDDAVQGV